MIEPVAPTNTDFADWTNLVADTIKKDVYVTSSGERVPQNLAGNIVPGLPPRADGYPTAEDVGAAYGVFRLVLRISTEEKISEPQPPDIVSDISAAINQLIQDFQNDLNSFPPVPNINTSGSFSWDALWDAIKKIAEWIGETLGSIAKTVFDLIKNLINTVGTAVSDTIKYALYLINKALFAVYNAFRDVLVYAGYAIPYTNKLSVDIGGGHSADSLWRSSGNDLSGNYPMEEIGIERDKVFTRYAPIIPPREQVDSANPLGGLFLERPNFSFTAPYTGLMLTPDVFIDPNDGPNDMFLLSGLQQSIPGNVDIPPAIAVSPKNFGGAVKNSIKGILLSESGMLLDPRKAVKKPKEHTLPNYNLDGDRAYAWPCWDITEREPIGGGDPPTTHTPLRPEAVVNDSTIHEAKVSVTPVND
jgi:hypothetical protein